MQTLHEYMMSTKSVEYLIAVVFLIAFIVFWRLVDHERRPKAGHNQRAASCTRQRH